MATDANKRLQLLKLPLPAELLAEISGNAPNEIKELPVKWLTIFRKDGKGFAGAIAGRLKVTEVSVVPHPHDPLKMEGKVVTEIDVEEGTHILLFYIQNSLDVVGFQTKICAMVVASLIMAALLYSSTSQRFVYMGYERS